MWPHLRAAVSTSLLGFHKHCAVQRHQQPCSSLPCPPKPWHPPESTSGTKSWWLTAVGSPLSTLRSRYSTRMGTCRTSAIMSTRAHHGQHKSAAADTVVSISAQPKAVTLSKGPRRIRSGTGMLITGDIASTPCKQPGPGYAMIPSTTPLPPPAARRRAPRCAPRPTPPPSAPRTSAGTAPRSAPPR
jgi:hypothetical protein